ncbi:Hsp20/alpha crystallin family protein [Natronobiforma cellulositropha]|uniref:Hsp20/alpha crystallin family protein n=1 Tax=Natronobiforma cellulositropha TaxID=1679076 RepID=UPI0021D5882C|nr:Hsp20/alpha crystallin family protein [Natronobiforma cellulositropha]
MSALRDALRNLPDGVFFDLLESDEAYLLVLDVPGVSPDSLELTVENGRISIEARREKDLSGEYRYVAENRPLFVEADLPLPDDADDEEADATVTHGVLELRLPKRDSATETTIEIVDEDG